MHTKTEVLIGKCGKAAIIQLCDMILPLLYVLDLPYDAAELQCFSYASFLYKASPQTRLILATAFIAKACQAELDKIKFCIYSTVGRSKNKKIRHPLQDVGLDIRRSN